VSIYKETTIVILCDAEDTCQCDLLSEDDRFEFDGGNMREAKKAARRRGWSFDEGCCYCPACSEARTYAGRT